MISQSLVFSNICWFTEQLYSFLFCKLYTFLANETNDKYPSHSMRSPPNNQIFPSQTYQYITNLLFVKEHLTRYFNKIVHLLLEY